MNFEPYTVLNDWLLGNSGVSLWTVGFRISGFGLKPCKGENIYIFFNVATLGDWSYLMFHINLSYVECGMGNGWREIQPAELQGQNDLRDPRKKFIIPSG